MRFVISFKNLFKERKMASITISDLHASGSELFSDSESYMNELGDGELQIINGGISTPLCASIAVTIISAVLVFSALAYR
jgi:hypothetical protein